MEVYIWYNVFLDDCDLQKNVNPFAGLDWTNIVIGKVSIIHMPNMLNFQ